MLSNTQRIAKGVGWIYSYRMLDRLLNFVSLAVLARILVPEDFGLVAVAASFVAIIEGLSDFDVRQALIQSRDEDQELYDSAWTLSALRGLLAALIMVVVAPFAGDPRITAILDVLALAPLMDGLANPRFVMFERDLVYSRLAVMTLAATAASVTVTLLIAVVYQSYWALVLGMVAASLVRLIASYALKPYRPRATFARWKDIFTFSGWMSLATVVASLSMRTDKIIIGRLLGFADAGAYFMTQRIGVLPTNELISPLQRILFPSFSQIAGEPDRLRRAVCESINVLGSLSLPAAVGFALIANDFVPFALGDQWLNIVPLLVVLVPFFGLRATLSSARSCVMALGQTQLMFKVSFVYALVHLPAFILGTATYGLIGTIWSIVLAGFFYTYLNAWLLKTTLGISLLEILAQLRRPMASVVTMVGAVLLLDRALPIDLFVEHGSWLALAIKIATGAAVFCATQATLWRLEGQPEGIEIRLIQAIPRLKPR